MLNVENPLIQLYIRLIGGVLSGFILGRLLPKNSATYLAKFLFFFGTPFSILAFMRRANLSGAILIAPLTAWIAILVGAGLAWIWIDLGVTEERLKAISQGIEYVNQLEPKSAIASNLPAIKTSWSQRTQGSFLLAMMVGNTGFLGIPVILSLLGSDLFAWALFYDLLGTGMGLNVLGIALAAHYGNSTQRRDKFAPVLAILQNPSLWAFAIGFVSRSLPLPAQTEKIVQTGAWGVITLSLITIGMQLSKLTSLRNLKQGLTCLAIKMFLTPLVVGTGLMFFGVTGPARLLLVLQMAMPPAFGTTLLAEAFNLDRELAVTTVAIGCVTLLLTIPIWMWLFGF
jgi:malate permease and related proteins